MHDGDYPMNDFIPNCIKDGHFVFPFGDFAEIILSQFRIVLNSGERAEMEMAFENFVSHRTDTRFLCVVRALYR
jgi:hypothetical protein